jgi:hypothetical protein
MGDRKEINKYIPPDFDPKHLVNVRIKKQSKVLIRFMLPFGVQCSTCGEFMGSGKKFNAKKEQAGSYLNIKRFRFYWKCNVCSTELVMSTDPKNQDYKLESGGTRIFDINRAIDKEVAEQDEEDQRKEEGNDAMTAMEAKAEASRREMDSLAALETLQASGERNRGIGPDQIMKRLKESDASVSNVVNEQVLKTLKEQEEEDMATAQEAFRNQSVRRLPDPQSLSSTSSSSSSSSVLLNKRPRDSSSSSSSSSAGGVSAPKVVFKRRKKIEPATLPSSSLGLTMYKSSSDDE